MGAPFGDVAGVDQDSHGSCGRGSVDSKPGGDLRLSQTGFFDDFPQNSVLARAESEMLGFSGSGGF